MELLISKLRSYGRYIVLIGLLLWSLSLLSKQSTEYKIALDEKTEQISQLKERITNLSVIHSKETVMKDGTIIREKTEVKKSTKVSSEKTDSTKVSSETVKYAQETPRMEAYSVGLYRALDATYSADVGVRLGTLPIELVIGSDARLNAYTGVRLRW